MMTSAHDENAGASKKGKPYIRPFKVVNRRCTYVSFGYAGFRAKKVGNTGERGMMVKGGRISCEQWYQNR